MKQNSGALICSLFDVFVVVLFVIPVYGKGMESPGAGKKSRCRYGNMVL